MIVNRKLGFLVILLIFSSQLSIAQKSKSQLQKEKLENLEKIAQAEKILA